MIGVNRCQPVSRSKNLFDPVSMIDGRFWDKLEGVARIVRKNTKPFGGMQIVLCGE